MESLSLIALIALSLVGYCAGAVSKAGRSAQLKPQIIDLVLIAVIWAGVVYLWASFEPYRWLMILPCAFLSIIAGILAVSPRKLPQAAVTTEKVLDTKKQEVTPGNLLQRLWRAWQDYFSVVGSFQSRIFLSLFFFIVVTPFALAVKAFSDPLRINYRGNESHWLPKTVSKADLEQSGKQY